MVQLETCWMDLDEMWCGCYAIGCHSKIAFFGFLQLIIPIWQVKKLEGGLTLEPAAIGPYIEYGFVWKFFVYCKITTWWLHKKFGFPRILSCDSYVYESIMLPQS
jgi:hypothetical protein